MAATHTIHCPEGHPVEVAARSTVAGGPHAWVETRESGDRVQVCDTCGPFVQHDDGSVKPLLGPSVSGLHIRVRVKNAFRNLLERKRS